jgi:hypothetical protein
MAPAPEAFSLERHPDVPTSVVYAAEDEIFEPAWIRLMARELLGEPIELPGGRFPMFEVPGRLTAVLEDLAPR